MVFYFSGTGNSHWVAEQLSASFDERLISIALELNNETDNYSYDLKESEKVFLVFPVHSWGLPVLVSRFIEQIRINEYAGQEIYSVATCGDECGYTSDMIRKMLEDKSLPLTKAYSIIMPNNYILLPGFDVDSQTVEEEKLNDAPVAISRIIENIRSGSIEEIYKKGSLSFLKSRIIYPLFIRFAIGKNSFYAKDNCTSCKLCEKICPTQTIRMREGRPQWSDTCVQCLACIHKCPVRAIEYGKITEKKGRYCFPE